MITCFYGISGIVDPETTNLSILILVAGILSILGGLVLLYGTYQVCGALLLHLMLPKTLQGQEGHILVFLLITTPCLFIETIKIGLEIITYSLSLESLTMFVVIFMILWAVQYIVYLFWKELRKVTSRQRVLNPGETVVVYSPSQPPADTHVKSNNQPAKSKSPKSEKEKKIENKPEVEIGTPV